LKPEEQ